MNATAGQPDDKVTLGIRPEHMQLASQDADLLSGTVSHVEKLGEASFVYLHIDGLEALVTGCKEGDIEVRIGDHMTVAAPKQSCHLFNSQTRAYPRSVQNI